MFPECNVGSQGETREEAIENGIEALSLWVETCVAHGSLEQVLKSHGIQESRAITI
ncbi:MAG: type II toxin-antitoxin system HicB family antitoxin [Desulfovibrionaceae bacterium]|nr:type II toxin-antitoxin system HicB family antitoxin [Desulfovibrionaceae bacterium]